MDGKTILHGGAWWQAAMYVWGEEMRRWTTRSNGHVYISLIGVATDEKDERETGATRSQKHPLKEPGQSEFRIRHTENSMGMQKRL